MEGKNDDEAIRDPRYYWSGSKRIRLKPLSQWPEEYREQFRQEFAAEMAKIRKANEQDLAAQRAAARLACEAAGIDSRYITSAEMSDGYLYFRGRIPVSDDGKSLMADDPMDPPSASDSS